MAIVVDCPLGDGLRHMTILTFFRVDASEVQLGHK
jgi:hypothetical protein